MIDIRWRKLIVPAAMVATIVATPGHAQTGAQSIFKCVDGEIASYQSMPCGNGQTEARVLTLARAPDVQARAADAVPKVTAPVPMAQASGKLWPPRRSLMLGMSDDEVLNLPGWGVPKQVARTRAPREWKEEWTYVTPTGERKLYFVNATLVDAVVDPDAARQVAIQQVGRKTYPAT